MMERLKCLIIEDEPLSQEVLVRFIRDVPDLELIGLFGDAIDAGAFLYEHEADLVFLDINLPKISGISFVKTLLEPPMIIFTTAYPEYAVTGFEMEAVDYLVKPIAFDRFLKAISKAREKASLRAMKEKEKSTPGEMDYLVLRSDKKVHKVNKTEIDYIESMGDYVKVHCQGKTLIVHETIGNLESTLASANFIRIHKSYLVSLSKVQYLEGNRVMVSGKYLPLGQMYKANLLRFLNP